MLDPVPSVVYKNTNLDKFAVSIETPKFTGF